MCDAARVGGLVLCKLARTSSIKFPQLETCDGRHLTRRGHTAASSKVLRVTALGLACAHDGRPFASHRRGLRIATARLAGRSSGEAIQRRTAHVSSCHNLLLSTQLRAPKPHPPLPVLAVDRRAAARLR